MTPERLEAAFLQLRALKQDELILVGQKVPDEARAWAAQRGVEVLERSNVKPGVLYLINPAALSRI